MKLDLFYYYLNYHLFWIKPFYDFFFSFSYNSFKINFFSFFFFPTHAENHWFIAVNKKELFIKKFLPLSF